MSMLKASSEPFFFSESSHSVQHFSSSVAPYLFMNDHFSACLSSPIFHYYYYYYTNE